MSAPSERAAPNRCSILDFDLRGIIHLCIIHSVRKYFLILCHVPGIVLGAGIPQWLRRWGADKIACPPVPGWTYSVFMQPEFPEVPRGSSHRSQQRIIFKNSVSGVSQHRFRAQLYPSLGCSSGHVPSVLCASVFSLKWRR